MAWITIAGAVGSATSAAANLISNGGFETGPPPGTFVTLAMPSTAMTGWTVSRGNVDYVGTLYLAQEGSCCLALNGSVPGGVLQSFSTYPGALYGVSFYLSGEPFSTPTIKHVRVAAASNTTDITYDASVAWPWDMHWLQQNWTFTATSDISSLELYSLDDGNWGPVIDNVVVTLLSPLDVTAGRLTAFALSPIAPNPTSDGARIDYAVPREANVRVSVFDLAGREIAVLADGPRAPGRYSARWDARGAAGAGMYFVRLQSPGVSMSRRLTVVH